MGLHGAIRSLSVSGRAFKVAHDASGTKDLGGRNNTVEMNSDGSYRTLQAVMPGAINDLSLEIDNSRGDQEFLQDLATEGLPVPVVVTYADVTSYTGDLVLTGEVKPDHNTGLVSISFMGGQLTQI